MRFATCHVLPETETGNSSSVRKLIDYLSGSLLLGLIAYLTFFPFAFASAQGSLQFNRVVYMTSGGQTVPPGKVWKVEKVMMPSKKYVKFVSNTGGSCQCDQSGGTAHRNYGLYAADSLDLNNVVIGTDTIHWQESSPLWLPAGTTVSVYSFTTPIQTSTPGSGCYCPYWIDGVWAGYGPWTPPQITLTSVISAIEFNVVP